MTTSTHSTVPGTDELTTAAQLEVLDVKGQNVTFGSIFQDQKTIVVFIQLSLLDALGHFFCGLFVEQLGSIAQDSLDKAGTKIVVVGCGEWQVIEAYAEMTHFTGPIYADPSRTIYRALGMTVENVKPTPSGEVRRSYLTKSRTAVTVISAWRAFMRPNLIGKQGNVYQLGGEFIMGPGLACTFASRMQHTEDHVETQELLKHAGVDS
ncbi:hypothetical protein DXG01_005758 [Tephrocybe rancida]|nr:hypothetical protein DXG01_005758 [Tephrocybe rancida]